MKVYLRILAFAKPYKFYVLLSLIASILYVLTNGLSLWVIGSLLSSVMSAEPLVSSSTNSSNFTDSVNSFIFQFIDGGNKVKVSMRFRGREMEHQNIGYDLLRRLTENVAEFAKVESPPKQEGKQISMILVPNK